MSIHPHNGEGLKDVCGAVTGDDEKTSPLPSACEPSLDQECMTDECGVTSGDDAVASLLPSAAEPTSGTCLVETVNLASHEPDCILQDCSGMEIVPDITDPLDDSVIESIASLIPLDPSITPTPEPSAFGLHALDLKLQQLQTTRSSFYRELREKAIDVATTRAHVDGGSQATTTDLKELIWHLQPFPLSARFQNYR